MNRFPEQFIMVARKHNGEYKYSLRSAGTVHRPELSCMIPP